MQTDQVNVAVIFYNFISEVYGATVVEYSRYCD